MEEIQKETKRIHLFVCCNDRNGERSSCGPTITAEMVKELKGWAKSEKIDAQITRTSCLGLCNAKGGSCMIYPERKTIIGISSSDDLKKIVREMQTPS